jgi:hypothetical protein
MLSDIYSQPQTSNLNPNCVSRLTLSLSICVLLFLNLTPAPSSAGEYHAYNFKDTIPTPTLPSKDSIVKDIDSLRSASVTLLKAQSGIITSKAKDAVGNIVAGIKKPDSLPRFTYSLPVVDVRAFKNKPSFTFNGGVVNYNLFYRANIDTPYQEKDIVQHTANGYLGFTVAGSFPVKLSWLARKSNSVYFRDIYDVKAEFDAGAFRTGLVTGFRQQLLSAIDHYKDSLADKLYALKLTELNDLHRQLDNPFTLQKLVEMNEVIRIPALTYDASLPDSIARKQSDSVRQVAQQFMDMYQQRKEQLEKLRSTVDSLQEKMYVNARRVAQLKDAINGHYQDWASLKKLKANIREVTGEQVTIPAKYQWLMGVRQMGVGRNQLNYSELSAKNISLNGVNFEYNSWYYFAVSAGLVDYRFRDFTLKSLKKTPQYLYLLRLGIGQLEKNYFIFSFFQGQKQLYPTYNTDKGIQPITVTGLTAEAKWQINKTSYVVTEVGQSASPNLRQNPSSENKFWDFSDATNKAFAVKLYSYLPRSNSRIEAQYKFTGANYQSFTSFQTNSAHASWYVKAEQNFFKRKLKISASLRSNEFSNPFIVQAYKSNTIFKSVQAVFRKRNWPTLSLGYMPASQYVKLDNLLLESRFQTLNASVNHIYKLGLSRAATTVVFNKFYNTTSDSGFTYFNAVNFILSQNFFFTGFNATLGIMNTTNSIYRLNVLDGGVQLPVRDLFTIGVGGKVNNLNNETLKIGYYASAQVKLFKRDVLSIAYEKGYLTGSGNKLVRNDFLNIGFSKFF